MPNNCKINDAQSANVKCNKSIEIKALCKKMKKFQIFVLKFRK